MSANSKTFVINDIARRLAAEKGGTIKAREEQVAEVFETLRSIMTDVSVDVKDRVFIKDFGIFKFKLRSGRTVTNGFGSFDVPPKYTWSFKPASEFVAELNADD